MSILSLFVLHPCKQCQQKRWLLGLRGLSVSGGVYLGLHSASFTYSDRIIFSCSVGAISLCLTHSIFADFPAYSLGNICAQMGFACLSGAGIGWCLRTALKALPKSTLLGFCAGALSVFLMNSNACAPNSGGVLKKGKTSKQFNLDRQDLELEYSSLPDMAYTSTSASVLDRLDAGEVLCSDCHSEVKTFECSPSNEELEVPVPREKPGSQTGVYRDVKEGSDTRKAKAVEISHKDIRRKGEEKEKCHLSRWRWQHLKVLQKMYVHILIFANIIVMLLTCLQH